MRTLYVVVLVSTALSAVACGGGGASDKAPMTPDSEHPLVDADAGMPAAPPSAAPAAPASSTPPTKK